jgi:hypothetical protein
MRARNTQNDVYERLLNTPCLLLGFAKIVYIHTPYMTVYLKKPLQIIPYTHRAYIYIYGSGQPCLLPFATSAKFGAATADGKSGTTPFLRYKSLMTRSSPTSSSQPRILQGKEACFLVRSAVFRRALQQLPHSL